MMDPSMASKLTVVRASFDQGPLSGVGKLRVRNMAL